LNYKRGGDDRVKKGDVGNRRTFIIKDSETKQVVDLTTAESAVLIWKVNGVRQERECVILEPFTDGKVQYSFVAGDLDIHGDYHFQVRINFSGGAIFTSTEVTEIVDDIL
jgi:hypothetical protein